RNAGGESARSRTVSTVPSAPPSAPSGLSATPGNGVVSLSWAPSPRATSYAIRRATSPTGPFEPVCTSAVTAFGDSTVANGTLYYYTVTALNSGGESAAAFSVAAAPVAPPAAPTGLQASVGNARVTLIWTPAPRAASYAIRRATSPGGPYAAIASPAGLSYVDTDVVNGTTFYYTVSALNIGGEGPPTPEVAATPVMAPAAVASLEATAGSGQVSLVWPAVEGATGYVVRRALSPEGPYSVIATPAAPAHVDAGLTNGTPYHYRVGAVNAGGESPESVSVTATPIAPPQAPTGLNVTPTNREATLSWTPSPRAQSYQVKRSTRPGGPYATIATTAAPTHQDTGLTN